jgi:hypothetical protein
VPFGGYSAYGAAGYSLIHYELNDPNLIERAPTLNCKEKRKMDRFSMELAAWISTVDNNGNPRSFEVVTRDICAGGAFLQTDQPLSVGTDIEMNLVLPLNNLSMVGSRRSRIDVSGSVVRTESQGMAVSFNKRYQISPVAG